MKTRTGGAVAVVFAVSALAVAATAHGASPLSGAGANCPPGYIEVSDGAAEYCVRDTRPTLSGRVIERTCGDKGCQVAPLRGVSVSAKARGKTPAQVTTGADGRWSIDVQAGRWKVTPALQDRSFDPASRTVVVKKRDVSNLNFAACGMAPEPRPRMPRIRAADQGDSLELSKKPVIVDRERGGTLSLKATIKILCPPDATLVADFLPIESFDPNEFAHGQPARVTEPVKPGVNKQTVSLRDLKVAPVVVSTGYTIAGMDTWVESARESGAVATPGGGRLIYSDYPEYIASTTGQHPFANFQGLGHEVEGVLYRQPQSVTAGGKFRLYFNPENRTDRAKQICMVATSPKRRPVRLTGGPSGLKVDPGDPVRAGHDALVLYERARRNPPGAAATVPAKGGWARCLAGLPPAGTSNSVANGLFDFKASGPLRIGLVVVNSKRAADLVGAPLKFGFADAGSPKGDPKRKYTSDYPLFNPSESEGHVEGTFPYNEVKVKVPYDIDSYMRSETRLADKQTITGEQYLPALDDGKTYLTGNYGVRYRVTVTAKGKPGREAQVILSPRGAGDQGGYVNAYSGVLALAASPGEPFSIPKKMSGGDRVKCPNPAENTGEDKVKCSNKGIGIGVVDAAGRFEFEMIPPGGATLPLALLLSPAYIHAKGEVRTPSGGILAKDSEVIPLRPDKP